MEIFIKHVLSGRLKTLPAIILFCLAMIPLKAQVSRQLTQNELNAELRTALEQNDEVRIVELIKNHRLYIKPFVDELVRESIRLELKGKLEESEKLNRMASKTAEIFNKIFNEKSLIIAVNYLTIWSKEQKEKKLIADSLYALGTKYRLGNEPEKAVDALSKALDIYSNIGDERGEVEVLGGLGALYFNDYENYSEALNYYREALVLRQKVDDKQLIGTTLNSLGASYHTYLKDYHGALRYYEQAKVVRAEIGDQSGLRTVMLNKARSLKELGNQLTKLGVVYPNPTKDGVTIIMRWLKMNKALKR